MAGVKGRVAALAALTAALGGLAMTQLAAAAPSNDAFSAASLLSSWSTTATGTNVAATRETGEPMHGGVTVETGSVWWKWTAPQSGTVRIDTIGSDFDTVLGVYTGSSVGALTTIASNDNGIGTYQSEVSFAATAGTTYAIAVAGFNYWTGNIRLSINAPRPANDDFVNAQPLTGASGSLSGTTERATGEPGEPAHWGGGPYHSVWYTWTGDLPSRVTFATSAPVGGSPAVAVYTGSSVSSLTLVSSGAIGTTFLPTPGTRYWIALDDWNIGAFTLTWSRPGPTNDNFDTSSFELLRGASGSVDSNTYFATKQVGEPAHAGDPGGASVWYLWSPGANGRVRISTAGSGFDTLLAVYSGSSLTALTPLASNDDAGSGLTTSEVTFDVNGGPNASYWIAVDGKSGATGPLKLTWAAVPPANDNLADALPLTGTVGSTSANLLGATVEPDEPTGMYEGPTVWWSWTPSTSGVAVFDTVGSPGDSTLRIFRGSSIAGLVAVAQDHDSAGGSDATASFVFRAGVRYLIQAATFDGGSVNLNWRVDSPLAPAVPANDAFAAATAISGEIGHVAGTVFGATNEAGEPRQREGGASVWYRWTAPASGAVYFSLPTIEGTWPAIVDVYEGATLGNLTLEDAGDVYGPGAVFAVAGRTYTIRVWSQNGFGRSFVLDWNRDQPSPPNDYFSAAQVLAGAAGSVPTTTYNATAEADEPGHGEYGASVWYRWTAPATGTYRFDLGVTSGAIDIFTGDSIRTLTRKTIADGAPATLAADAGVTYSIAVVGGPFHATLEWGPGAPAGGVANDAFADATPLSDDHGTLSGTNVGATSEGGEPAATQWGSVWFRFTVPATGTYAFDTFGSSFDTVLGAYAGSTVGALTSLAFDDDAGGAPTSLVTVGAQAGTTLWIAVASNGQFGGRGDWTINWKRSFTTPPNDAFASPTVVTGTSGSVTASNVGASKEPGEPNHGGVPGGASVWFSWTAPQSGPFAFHAANPALATQLAVYTGSSVSTLTAVAPTEGPPGASTVRFTAVAGTTYRIAVDGWYDDGTTQRVDTGSFDLTWSPRPDNDDWGAARPIDAGGSSAGGTLVGATLEPGEPPTGWAGGSVWFALTSPTSGVYAVSVDGGGDAVLDAWTGSSVSTLTRIAASDDYGPPALSLPASAGTTYYIRVALEYGAPQPFTLRWTRGGPDNDSFAAAQPLSALLESGAWTRAVTVSGTNAGATLESGEPLHAGQAGGASVWWTFTSPVAGYVSVDTAGSSFDTLLGVYTGSTVSALTQVGADDDAAGAGASRVVFWSPANAVYRIAVDGKGGATGVIRLRVQPADPANDAFAAAQVLSGAGGALTANNNGATKEPGEPDHAGNPGGHSLWYRWTAPATGAYDFDVAADYFGALIGIYTGSSVDGLTPIASAAGDEFGGATARLGATAGTTYMIAIDGSVYGLQTGQIRLSWRPDAAATSNDMYAGAQELTGWSGSVSGTNAAASSEAGEQPIGIGQTLWYRWTAPADGAVAFDVEHPFDGEAIDPVAAMYVGPSVGALVRVSDVAFAVHQRVTGGTTYWIQVDDSDQAGAFVLDWRQLSPPANDDYAAAVALTADHLSLTGTLADASRERGEPQHDTAPTVSVWYRWTAPRSGRVTVDLRPQSLDDPSAGALASVYTGDSLTSLARVTGSAQWWGREVASRLHFDAVGGTTYSIAVTRGPGGYPPESAFRLNLALPPANDAFAAAAAVTGVSGAVAGRNSGATKEPGEPDHSGNRGGASIWYRWTAPATGTVIFDTAGSVPDTLLAAYTGVSLSSLTEVARDDQAGGANDARLVFDVTMGTTYSIALDGFYGPYLLEPYDDTDTGDTVLNWRMAPANDTFASAERVDDRSGRVAGSTVGATKEPGEPAHAGDPGGHSVWYSWTAGADGDVTVDTSGSSFDTLLAVYTGSNVDTLTQVAADDDADGLTTSHVRFRATAGTTYSFAVDGKGGRSGRVFLQWRLEGAPSNDDLANALPLTGTKGNVLVDNTWATKEPGEPAHAGVAGGASVWYSWTSPVTAHVTFETERDYSPDTALAIYTGGGYGSLVQVGASDDRSATDPSSIVGFSATAGTTYLIAVDTRNGVYGTFELWWNRPPDNDDRLVTHGLSGPSGTYSQTNWWATTQTGELPIAGATGGASVWFAWTAPVSGTVTFDTVGSDFDTLLALYPDDYYTWTQLAVDDDSGGAGTSRVSLAVTAGQTYELAVDGKAGAMGTIQLHWSIPVAAPANDSFASAFTLTGSTASSSSVCSPCTTLGATAEVGEPVHAGAGHSVWFKWTAPASSPVALTATTGDFGLWSTADVYTGSSVGALTQVARSPADGYESETIWKAVAGTTYAIAIDTRSEYPGGADTGNVALSLAQGGAAPANDDFAAAQAISGDSGTVTGTSADASPEAGEPRNGGGRTVWYRWTPTTGGRVTLTPTASGSFYYDFPHVTVYTGTSLTSLTRVPVEVAPNPNWPQPAPFRFRVDPGVAYYLQVDGSNPTPGAPEAGQFTLQWSTLAGDYFSGPIRLAGANGTVRANTTLATKEGGEPAHARNVGGHSLWYAWTPTVSGDVTVDTAGTSFDSVLAVYTGSSLTALTEVASNDDAPGRSTSALTFAAVAGTTYRIAVDGYSGAAGDLVLGWSTAGVPTDTNPPTVSLTAPAASAFVGRQVTVSADAADDVAVAQVEFFADGISLGVDTTAPYSVLWQTTTHADGTASLTARATDTAGNTTTTVARAVTVDNTAPTATITGRPTSPNPSATSTFSFTSNETGATFQCRLDTGAWAACSSPVSYTLSAGDHWFYVEAVDRAGNVGNYDYANWTQIGPPANDAFVDAQPLAAASGTVTGTTQNATKEPGEPNHAGNAGGHSVWYRWTAQAGGTVTVSTAGSSFDTLLAVYTGTAVSALTRVASNNDVSNRDATSRLTFTAVSGTTYRIAVDGYRGAYGAVTLNWSGPAPAVDTTPPDTTITSGPAATTSATDASFAFTATEAATFECRLDGAAWTTCTSPKAYTALAAGAHTFDVRATDAAGNVDATPASRTWTIQAAAPPASNDNFADATTLAGASGAATGTTVGMTKETGEPNHAGNAGGHSIWFAWTAPAAGSVTIDTAGSTFDTLLAVYTGTAVGSLTAVASNDDANGTAQSSVTFSAVSGTTYRIAVDGFGGATGSVTLHWSQAAAPSGPANDNFAAAAALSGSAGGSTVGATKETGEPNHAGNAGGHSIWWTWTAPAGGSATITTAGSSFDTLLAVYTGSAIGALTAVASNDDANGTTQSQVSFTAVAGTTYRVAVDGYAGAAGSVAIRVTQP